MDYADLPPASTDLAETERVAHTRLRRRMLTGQHREDLADMIQRDIGSVRKEAWGAPDLSANPYLAVWTQLAALYSEEPEVHAEGADGLIADVSNAGLWAMMSRVQRDTLALREMLVRVDVVDNLPTFRPVYPDMAKMEAHPRRPGVPVKVKEWVKDARLGWVRLVCSVADPAAPYFAAYLPDGTDVSMDILGGAYAGEAYPYRRTDGTPILPYVLYHAAETGFLLDPYAMREVVEGSLKLGVYLTYFGHVLKNAAWAQRYAVGVIPAGMDTVDGDTTAPGSIPARREVVTDPSSLLLLTPTLDATGQPLIGQWTSPADPEAILRSIAMYEKRILTLAGVRAPEATRSESDIRSGYSLAVSREAIREAQESYEPQFRRSDALLLATTAALLNRFTGTAYPETPSAYRLDYEGLPETPSEERARLDRALAMLDAGLTDRAGALMLLDDELTRADAEAKIAALNPQPPTPPTP